MKYLIDLALKKCWQKVGCVVKNSQNGFGICCSVTQSCPTLCNPWTAAHQVFLSNSCPLSWWCHPTISFSVALFSFCPQSFPASESFLMSQLFTSGGWSTGASASASVLAVEIQGWLPLGLTSLISLLSKELLSLFQHHSLKASILWRSAYFIVQLSHPCMTTGKTIALTRWTFAVKVISLLFNTLSRFVITFLPRCKHLLISWLQSLPTVILECKKMLFPSFHFLFSLMQFHHFPPQSIT